jgi:hypothetical protein
MRVWYNASGVIQMADITAVNAANGTVSLNVWPAGVVGVVKGVEALRAPRFLFRCPAEF